MKLFQAFVNLNVLSLSLLAHADNTPDLCTADIPDLEQIKPSVTYAPWVGEDWASHTLPIPDITVGGETYSGDAEHFVTRPPLRVDEVYKELIIYIPGTTDRPALSSCLLKTAAKQTVKKRRKSEVAPVIGLSYQYLSSGDVYRNRKCASLATATSNAEQVNCLEQQHVDAIYGGDYGATHSEKDDDAGNPIPMWGEVKREHALHMRLFYLLQHLDATYPNDGWKSFYSTQNIDGEDIGPTIAWRNIVVSGHSQGAGHAAYLAKTKEVRAAVMISGPQDNCDDCDDDETFWIDEGPYASDKTKYTALGHGEEPLHDIQVKNWKKMQAVAGARMKWKPDVLHDVDFGLKVTGKDAKTEGPLVSYVKVGAESTCGGKEHCSTAIDDSVPFYRTYTNETYYLYETTVWPSIFSVIRNPMGIPKCHNAPPGWATECN